MPRFLKRLLLVGGALAALLVAGLALLGWWALRQFTPERVVHQLESLCNARVQLDDCSLSLFSSPARLELTGLHFNPRDAEADAATPPASRPPIKITNTYVRMRRGVVEIDLRALLLRREYQVHSFLVEVGDLKYDLLPDGGTSLRTLFRAPATVRGQPNTALVALAPVAAVVAAGAPAVIASDSAPPAAEVFAADEPGDDQSADGPIPPIHASRLPGPIAIDSVRFVDARIRARNRKTRAVTELNQLQFEITDLAIDAGQLATTNRATLALQSRVWIDGGRKNPGRLAEFTASVHGQVTPFDAATGLLQPHATLTATIAEGASLRTLAALEKLEKNLARARRAGLQIDPFAPQAVLSAKTILPLRFHANRLTLTEPTILDFTDYALALAADSHVNITDESHDVTAAWIASQTVSDRALAGADRFLRPLGDGAGGEMRRLLIDPLLADGRLRMEFRAHGPIAKPEVRIAHPLQDVTDQLKGSGRALMDRLRNN